jgi:N-acylglucosamine 2-epimerase
MKPERIEALKDHYRRSLLDDVVPFWLQHSLDHEYGGSFNSLARDGEVYDTDKAMWLQARAVWLFSKLYNTVENRQEWMDAARLIYEFILQHGFDTDGRMFFSVTRDGKPLRKRRYLFTETFGVIACAEYARATGDSQALQRAKDLYQLIVDYLENPDKLPPKVYPQTRQTKSHATPMIMLATTQEIRQVDDALLYQRVVDDALDQILNQFVKRDERALLETVGPNGERLDSVEGRKVNPGHALESAWFIMHEGMHRQDNDLIRQATDIITWSLELGWDKEYGGILYFVDVEGKSPVQLEWDMKLWWPHTEALYALLLAYHLTAESKYVEWYEKVHDWSFSHFADPEYGEWFGYLHRDGTVSSPAKGGMWKGAFHLPRTLLYCQKLLEIMAESPSHLL